MITLKILLILKVERRCLVKVQSNPRINQTDQREARIHKGS